MAPFVELSVIERSRSHRNHFHLIQPEQQNNTNWYENIVLFIVAVT